MRRIRRFFGLLVGFRLLGWRRIARLACGAASDGCKATLDCGKCDDGKTCSSGKCACVPKTCADLGLQCGGGSDGCGKTLACGTCGDGKQCVQGKCACKPKTCAELGVSCGTPPDSCGGKLTCGTCSDGKVCGPSGQCNCAPKTCKDLAIACGSASDGCGKAIACGTCGDGQQCTGGKCVCKPKSCDVLGCGKQPDGCGGTVDCGPCGGACGTVCPAGFNFDNSKVCSGGNIKGIDLPFCTVKVSGTILNNGKTPQRTQYCSATKNGYSTYVQVELEETTWGYKYTIGNRCSDATKKGFTWTREIYPGTYKVKVYGTSNYANFPFTGTQVVVPKIALQ